MTQDEIIEMARKIANEASKVGPYRTWTHEHAMSLIMQLVDASAAKEREACALICDKEVEEWKYDADVVDVAIAIRARGEA
jgi:hypothetical protein